MAEAARWYKLIDVAEECVDKRLRVERREVARLLADTDEAHREAFVDALLGHVDELEPEAAGASGD